MDKINVENVEKGKSKSRLFYILSVLMLLYMGFTAITSFQSFMSYCETYQLVAIDNIGIGIQTILAAIIPCLVYSATLYGIGLLLDKEN